MTRHDNDQQPADAATSTTGTLMKSVLNIAVLTLALVVTVNVYVGSSDPELAVANAEMEAQGTLNGAGYDWARVNVEDGIAVITGEAPREADRVMAYEMVRNALRTAMGEARIVTGLESRLALAKPTQPAPAQQPVAIAGTTAAPIAQVIAPATPPMQERLAIATAPSAPKPSAAVTNTATVTGATPPANTARIETSAVNKEPMLAQVDCKTGFAGVLSKSTIAFGVDSAKIEQQSTPVLDQLANIANRCGAFQLTIEGHTDITGRSSHNLQLSQKRAEAVREALVARGVAKHNINAKGYGASKPVAAGMDDAALAKNRRIAFAVSELTNKPGGSAKN